MPNSRAATRERFLRSLLLGAIRILFAILLKAYVRQVEEISTNPAGPFDHHRRVFVSEEEGDTEQEGDSELRQNRPGLDELDD